jgi:O-antigen ligase
MRKNLNFIDKLILIGIFLTSIFITPMFLWDPFNIPKFFIVVFLGLALSVNLFINRKVLIIKNFKLIVSLIICFIVWSLIISINSQSKFVNKIIGGDGRYTSLATYVFVAVFMIAGVVVSRDFLNGLVLKIVILAGGISSIYGFFQSINLDPIIWSSPNGNVFGFSGNPNFHSAFIAISSIAATTLIFNKLEKLKNRLMYLIVLFLGLYNIQSSSSKQGLVLFLIGLVVYSNILIRYRFPKYTVLSLVITFNLFIMSILDVLQNAPWSSLLYEPSVSYRGDYWRSAWRMTIENPYFGVGYDGFKNNYRLFRDLNSNRTGVSTNVDSSHNAFLDFSTSGGLVLLVLFICINCLLLFSVLKYYKFETKFNPVFTGVFLCWFLLFIQSLISVPKIQLLVIQWTLAGLIIGYKSKNNLEINNLNSNSNGLILISSFMIAILIAGPFLVKDAKFRSSLQNGKMELINKTLLESPKRVEYFVIVSSIYEQATFYQAALEIAREATKVDKNNFEAWQIISNLPNTSEKEREYAELRMRQLDQTLTK